MLALHSVGDLVPACGSLSGWLDRLCCCWQVLVVLLVLVFFEKILKNCFRRGSFALVPFTVSPSMEIVRVFQKNKNKKIISFV